MGFVKELNDGGGDDVNAKPFFILEHVNDDDGDDDVNQLA